MDTTSITHENHIEQAERYAAELCKKSPCSIVLFLHHHGKSEVFLDYHLDRTFRAPPLIALPKATIYYRGEFGLGYHKVEVRDLEVHEEGFAQYANALRVIYTPKGGKRRRDFEQTAFPSLVVLEGWGHLDPPSMWSGETNKTEGGATVQRARHSACSEGWTTDFRTALQEYLSVNPKARLVRDFHGHQIRTK